MNEDNLTILTQPCARRNIFQRKAIGGHYAVTRSLLAGLDSLGVPYRYNPALRSRVTRDVWVLAGLETLKFAIQLKKAGKIRFLGAGPNISVLPSWDDHLLAVPEVDICAVPSQWVADAYLLDSSGLEGRIRTWYAGVDPVFWSSAGNSSGEYCLVYCKTKDTPLVGVLSLLRSLNIPTRVVGYGNYCQDKYKRLLQNASCMVTLSHSESQGIALAEAWAMNVPTFCWNPGFSYCGVHCFENVHAAPYITDMTGAVWKELDELKRVLIEFSARLHVYRPRYWLSCYMTDAIAARMFLNLYATALKDGLGAVFFKK